MIRKGGVKIFSCGKCGYKSWTSFFRCPTCGTTQNEVIKIDKIKKNKDKNQVY